MENFRVVSVVLLNAFVFSGLSGCLFEEPDETLFAYGAGARQWTLKRVNEAPFEALATLKFVPEGVVTGQAPCNAFSATQTAPYPWFAIKDVQVTRMACENAADEVMFFETLNSMTVSEVLGDVMILSNDAGQDMFFTAQPL